MNPDPGVRRSTTPTTPARADRAPRRGLDEAVQRERATLLDQVHETLDGAMVALSVAWIVLLIIELAGGGLPPLLDAAVWAIWAVFLVDFALEFVIAPLKMAYLREHWLTALSLALPALRIVRVFAALRVLRAARVVRSVGLLRILTSVNRGLASLRRTAARRGLGYLLAATALVMLVGAAGMASFESSAAVSAGTARGTSSIDSYVDALWWVAYTMTTGATSEPVTSEGRLLGWLLSLYGLAVFGYLTATLASHFVGRERRP